MNKFKPSTNKGQSLLVLVLMIAIVLALVSAASYRLTVQTQSAESQAEAIQALAAADAGIERGLLKAIQEPIGTFTFDNLGLELPGIDPVRSQVLITQTGQSLASPIIQRDSQFLYYVKDITNPSAPNFNGTINIYFRSEEAAIPSCDSPRNVPAYEVTYIYGNNGENTIRDIVEPCTSGSEEIQQSQPSLRAAISNGPTTTIDGEDFTDYFTVNPSAQNMADLRLIIVRSLFGSSRLGFRPIGGSVPLPAQGKWIESRAYSISGASRIIRVYQSLPQIPAEFFVTTF